MNKPIQKIDNHWEIRFQVNDDNRVVSQVRQIRTLEDGKQVPALRFAGGPVNTKSEAEYLAGMYLREQSGIKTPIAAIREDASQPRGKWRLSVEHDNCRDEIWDQDGRCIALVWTRKPQLPGASARCQYQDSPEGKANAHLIEAAPDLLNACKRMAKILEQGMDPKLQGIACDIFNAIAKAERHP